MASNTKIVLRKKPNKFGEYPLAIRISKDRRTSYIYLGHYVDAKYWDAKKRQVKRSHPNSAHLNNFLEIKLAETGKVILKLQAENKDISASQIKEEIESVLNKKDFFQVAQEHLDELENNNRLSQHSSDKARINHLKKYSRSSTLPFKEISERFLKGFINYLKSERKVSERSVVNNLVVIRTIYNRGIKMGLVDRKLYPFGHDKIAIKFPETEKVGLNASEIKKIENLASLSESQKHARDVWLFSFYLAGIRASDVLQLKWSDIYDGRLHYTMKKNSKIVSLLIPDKAKKIIDSHQKTKGGSNDFIFPYLKYVNSKDEKVLWKKTKLAIRKINDEMSTIADKAEINKKITMHIARHSFGNIAGDNIPVQLLQQLYRHSSITTTMMYQSNFMNKKTDDALQSVVNF
ncbi:MAG: phage integrase SAM-like domain-containing protein [Muricauda sp.]|nr:site-specific integrase [Allomuricauda sp.]MBA4745640.1 phage integrase SAM-like domain-containing protein [Allomuricauda sp.]